MRFIYSILITLSTPLVLFYFLVRGFRDRRYVERLPERFGYLPFQAGPGGILVHAASVGEFNAAAPLIKTLRKRHPDLGMTVTCITPTGSERIRADLGDRVEHCYLPFDLPWAAPKFLAQLQPSVIVVMETEIWPNLYLSARKLGIPLLMVNARLSERSVKRLSFASGLVKRVLGSVSWIGAQSSKDFDRFRQCGAENASLEMMGNLKFDLGIPDRLFETAKERRLAWSPDRPVLVAGSTHEADENVLLPAFARLLKTIPGALLVLVPRYPERFESAAQLAQASGLATVLRSQSETVGSEVQCLVIDAMGELMVYYACADVAFVGGSVGDQGGHNPLEPAALAKPVLFGKNMVNAREIADQLMTCDAAKEINSVDQLHETLVQLFQHDEMRDQMGQAGLQLIDRNKGALDSSLAAIETHL